ncbi:hypothetical protein KKA17_04085, partial [bacterium]|nr:hypothetical protein [bacterium]
MSSSNLITDVVDGVVIIKTKADVTAVVVGADGDNKAGAAIGALTIAATLASFVKNVPGINNSLAAASLYNNYLEAIIDINNPDLNNKIDDNTMMSLLADAMAITSLAATMAAAAAVAPAVAASLLTIAAVSTVTATALAVSAALQDDNSTVMSDAYIDILNRALNMKNDFNLSDYIDALLNPTSDTQPLPGLDGFNYFDPNNPNNYNPNDGYPLNPPTDPTNPDDGIPPNYLNPPTPPRRDPLVLDTDKDGFISTITLQDSNAYFDITGDGIKEKVSWIKSNDGILTYDKNENGKIDGIDEVFGNLTTSGFEELKQLIDSNHDNVIDRRDELYSRLKVWHDKNADGISQADELSTLKDE